MQIAKKQGLPPPPPRTVNQYKLPTVRMLLIDQLKSLSTPEEFLELTDDTRTQREISSIVRAIAHQSNMKVVVRYDADEKTVRVWRKP